MKNFIENDFSNRMAIMISKISPVSVVAVSIVGTPTQN